MRVVALALLVGVFAPGRVLATQPISNPAVEANTDFALRLFSRLTADQPEHNILFSPYSVFTALVMVAEGARNETADQMGRVLGLPDTLRNTTSDASIRPWNLLPLHAHLSALNARLTGVKQADLAPIRERIAALRRELDETNREAEESGRASEWRRHKALVDRSQELANELNELLARLDQYEIRLANALWGERQYPFLQSYVDTIGKYYNLGGSLSLDFAGDYSGSIDSINAWVDKQTNHRIEALIGKDLLPEDERKRLCLIITNAIYFQGNWAESFLPSETKPDVFTLSNGKKIEVSMMHHRSMGKSRYGAFNADGSLFDTPSEIPYGPTNIPANQPPRYPTDGGFTILEMPYKGGDLSMVIIVPVDANGMPALLEKLSAHGLATWLDKLEQRKVSVFLPRFKCETTYDMSKILRSMGMARAFVQPTEPEGAQFDGMCASQDPQRKMYVSLVLHKARLEITERGTEAVAGTAIMMPPPPAIPETIPFVPIFRADRPFLFFIRDSGSGIILFLGRLVGPGIF